MNYKFVVLGDFKILADVPNEARGARLLRLFDEFGVRQHIETPTHDCGHTLDLVVASDAMLVDSIERHDVGDCLTIKKFTLKYSTWSIKRK